MAEAQTTETNPAQAQATVPTVPTAELKTKRQLVVVVHGVGVKEAGVSADLLATALEDVPDSHGEASLRSFEGHTLRPHSSDDFHLRELEIYNSGGKRQVFPARIRRYRNNDETGRLVAERVVADFYWGDISNIASGIAGLFLGILKTILGLCHVVRESAWSVFPGNTGANPHLRKIARSAALMIHGPIASINVVIIGGVFLHSILTVWMLLDDNLAAWATALAAIVLGFYFARSAQVFLARWFFVWSAATGLLLSVFLAVLPIQKKPGVEAANYTGAAISKTDIASVSRFELTNVDITLLAHVCALPSKSVHLVSPSCIAAYDGFFLQGLRILGLMGIAWLWVIFVIALTATAEIVRMFTSDRERPPALVSASIALMTLLWILMIASIWATVQGLPFETLPKGMRSESILGTTSFSVISLALLLVAEITVFWRTGVWSKNCVPETYIDQANPSHAQKIGETNRLIISPWALATIWVFFALMLTTSLIDTLRMLDIETRVPSYFADANFWLQSHFGSVMAGLALVGGLLFAAGQQALRAGLGIAIDVITWLNDDSWTSTETGSKATRNIFERLAPAALGVRASNKAQGYWRRERIKNRLKVMMEKLIRDERPNEVVFVSHSQGTVVAIDVLSEMAKLWRQSLGPQASIKLVTMGSPYTHIHRHYYPASFQAIASMESMKKHGDGGALDDWINIFRIDDFVGTFIDPTGRWPREHPVPANGHTYYWVDENVFPILKKFVS